MSKKIFWTTEEREQVWGGLVELFRQHPNMTNKRALAQAQVVLSTWRRRKITDQVAFNSKQWINAARLRAYGSEEKKPEPAPGPVAAPQAAPVAAPALELGTAFELLLDMIADRVVARIKAAQVLTEVRAESGRPVVSAEEMSALLNYDAAAARQNAKAREALTQTPTGKPRPGVLVCGIQPHQAELLIKDFPQFDLTCYDSDEARVKPVLRRKHVFLLTRFLSHQVDERYRGSPNLQRIPGGVSELRETLTRISREGQLV